MHFNTKTQLPFMTQQTFQMLGPHTKNESDSRSYSYSLDWQCNTSDTLGYGNVIAQK